MRSCVFVVRVCSSVDSGRQDFLQPLRLPPLPISDFGTNQVTRRRETNQRLEADFTSRQARARCARLTFTAAAVVDAATYMYCITAATVIMLLCCSVGLLLGLD